MGAWPGDPGQPPRVRAAGHDQGTCMSASVARRCDARIAPGKPRRNGAGQGPPAGAPHKSARPAPRPPGFVASSKGSHTPGSSPSSPRRCTASGGLRAGAARCRAAPAAPARRPAPPSPWQAARTRGDALPVPLEAADRGAVPEQARRPVGRAGEQAAQAAGQVHPGIHAAAQAVRAGGCRGARARRGSAQWAPASHRAPAGAQTRLGGRDRGADMPPLLHAAVDAQE
jgi:hypothetical protein